MSKAESKIITDVDGVLLNMFDPLVRGISKYLGKEPNSGWQNMYWTHDVFSLSSEDGDRLTYHYLEKLKHEFLEPMPNAVEGVKYLYEKYDVKLICVTAIGNDWRQNRIANLKHYFGDAIEEVLCTDGSANKPKYLKQFSGSGHLWVEDLVKNAEMGLSEGLEPVLIKSGWNQGEHSLLTANDWLDVAKIYESKFHSDN